MATIDKKKFGDFFRFFANQPQQLQALSLLYEEMPKALLDDQCDWIRRYREKPPAPPTGSSDLPPAAIDLICEFEGFRANVYDDGVGQPTIGYGSTHYANGEKVAFGDPSITEPAARALLMDVAEEYWKILGSTIPFWSEMNSNQQGALLSFGYNLGPHFFGAQGFSTISRLLSDKDWSGVPAGLLLYVNPGTSVEAGLRRRRLAEGELWSSKA